MSLVTALWKRAPGLWGCLCTKSGAGKWQEHFFKRPFSGVDQFIRDNQDKDTYWCVHLFDRQVRRKEHAVLPSMLWADLDEVDPAKCSVKPTVAIESSPGRYVGVWFLDGEMTEDLNRRLTYHLGADTGGWDLTQVLRVPNTTNYKYASMPRVRLLWEDGPVWKTSELQHKLPQVNGHMDKSKAAALYAKYEESLPRDVRSLMNAEPDRRSDRSAVLWKLERSLVEAGASRTEAFIILKSSPWNKFADRRGGDEQLRHELDKGVDTKLEKRVTVNEYKPFQRSIADIEEEDTRWVWYPYFARGEVTTLEGDPGVGKSYAMQIVAKSVCDGDTLPSPKHGGKVRIRQGIVMYADIENSAARVTKKRLRMNACQHMEKFFQEEEPFTIEDDKFMRKMYDVFEEAKPTLVVFDTLNLYVGKADLAKATETTQSLSRFKEIAVRFDCSVVVVRHLTKGRDNTKALYRGQGNIAVAGASRILLTVGQDPEDREIKVLSVTKNNLAPTPRSLTFTIRGLPDTLKESDRSQFAWGEYSDLTSEDILGLAKKSEGLEEAVEFLKEFLSEGPEDIRQVRQAAEARNISKTTLYRAADKLGIDHARAKHASTWSISR